jgi:diguanylate cyclase (GGDEF)-like protein
LRGRSRTSLLVAGLGVVAGVGYLDVLTGPDLTPVLFFLLPIVVVAWYAGRGPGTVVATGGALAWLVAGLRRVVERAREIARTDALTGVANVQAFYTLAATEIARARRYRHPFTIAFLDLDDFKTVNDRLGHSAGDAVLRTVARAIVSVMRASDIVARVGGDEFVVLLPETGTAPARLAIEKLRQAVSGLVPAHGWRLTASIGVATYLVPPESVDVLVGTADQLMFAAKRNGKNAVSHETQNAATAAD